MSEYFLFILFLFSFSFQSHLNFLNITKTPTPTPTPSPTQMIFLFYTIVMLAVTTNLFILDCDTHVVKKCCPKTPKLKPRLKHPQAPRKKKNTMETILLID